MQLILKAIGATLSKLTLKQILAILAVILALGLWWYVDDLQADVKKLKATNATLEANVVTANKALVDYKAEEARVTIIENTKQVADTKVEVQKEYINHETIKYIKDPAVKHSSLDPKWVRIHNAATMSSTQASDSSGRSKTASGTDTEADTANYQPTPDDQALSVITENYSACLKLYNDNVALWDIIHNYKP